MSLLDSCAQAAKINRTIGQSRDTMFDTKKFRSSRISYVSSVTFDEPPVPSTVAVGIQP